MNAGTPPASSGPRDRKPRDSDPAPRHLHGMVPTMNGTGFMFEVRDRFADDFIRVAGESKRPVLEIGCAYGVSTLPALEAGGIVTACDMEPQHLQVLKSKVRPELLPHLELVTGKLPEVDFAEGRYAAILCSRVLHFLSGEDISASVAKMARWLAPGGRLYLIADTPYGIWRKLIPQFEGGKATGVRWPGFMEGIHNYLPNPTAKKIEKPPFLNLLDPDLLARTCEESGLQVLEAAFIPRPDFDGLGQMDGRENAGVLAARPG